MVSDDEEKNEPNIGEIIETYYIDSQDIVYTNRYLILSKPDSSYLYLVYDILEEEKTLLDLTRTANFSWIVMR